MSGAERMQRHRLRRRAVTKQKGKHKPAPLEKRKLLSGLIVDEPADMPTEAEAEEEYQATLYDQVCRLLGEMTGETRQRYFAHIKRKYGV